MQLGDHAIEVLEPIEECMALLEGYLEGFTCAGADPEASVAVRDFVQSIEEP